jgi:hypothetical protein
MLTSLQAHLDELCFWSARDSTRGVGGVTWSSARHLAELLNAYGQRVQSQYSTLLVSCDQLFAPLSDPLRCDLGLHAWLAPEREESYSKWLHWTLKQFAECGTLGEILDLPIPSASNTSGIQLFNERTIRSRDRKRFGRIDIVVWHGEMSAILEIKTKSFTDEALEKHLLYCESPDVPPEAARIFIGQNADGLDLRGFRLLDWKEVCVRLRRRVQRCSKSGDVAGKTPRVAVTQTMHLEDLGESGSSSSVQNLQCLQIAVSGQLLDNPGPEKVTCESWRKVRSRF